MEKNVNIENTEQITAVGIVPIWEKQLLSINEAAQYFGIGQNRLRRLCATKGSAIALYDGNRYKIKRVKFQEYLDSAYSI